MTLFIKFYFESKEDLLKNVISGSNFDFKAINLNVLCISTLTSTLRQLYYIRSLYYKMIVKNIKMIRFLVISKTFLFKKMRWKKVRMGWKEE